MMKVACWKDSTGSPAGTFVAGDEYAWCHYNDGITGSQKFNYLLQGSANANSYIRVAADATTAQAGFGGGVSGTDKSISAAMQTAKAAAQVNLWFADWVSTALTEDLTLTGNETNKAAEVTADTWKNRTIGAAEATETTKTNLYTASQKEKAAAERWKAAATQEAADALADLVRARTLLADLTAEIAPLARDESAAKTAYDAAVAAQAVRVAATAELGDLAVAANASAVPPVVAAAATGARAVLDAAAATKASVEAQQAFHDARADWAADNLAPVATELADVKAHQAALDLEVAAAETKFDNARKACKVAAFEGAQEAREKAVAMAAARADKASAVLKDYTALSAFPTDRSAGTLCHYGKVAADAAQTPRTECLEGEPGKPLCCGAAQRFLKDGTKLSIETCQLATASTYTYYPAIDDGALVAPTAETWRFQCISAAQKLAAAATAALAAGYMMA
jgi:hypothetical protein